jgi:two-component system response regulator
MSDARDAVILLVEDNPDDEELTLLALAESRVSNPIVVARDGAEAVDYLFGSGLYSGRDPSATPRMVLLDLKLPKIDGLDVLRRIRANPATRLTPVVVLTTSREDRDLTESYRLGANSYIRKPVDFAQFSQAVRQLSHYWLGLNEAPPRVGGAS